MAGLKQGVTREDFEAGLKNNDLEPLVHTMNVQAGESIFIPSGRIHAIGGGNPRELHIEESLKSSDFNDFNPETLKPTDNCEPQPSDRYSRSAEF
jgi:mannose-6-phosphate isomerase